MGGMQSKRVLELNSEPTQQAGHCQGWKQLQHLFVDTKVELVIARNVLCVFYV